MSEVEAMDEEDHRRAEEEMKDLYLTHMQKRKDSERFMRRLCGLVYKAAFMAMGVATMGYILPLNRTLRRVSSSFFEGDKQDQGALTAVSALLLALALSFAVLARPRPASEYEAFASTEFFHYSVTFPVKQEDDDSEAVILSEVEESEVDGSVPLEVISKYATVDSRQCHITNQCAVSAAATTDDDDDGDDDSCGDTRLGSEEDSISICHDTSSNANTSKQGAPETRVSDVSGEEVGNVLNEWVGHRSELITVASVETPPQSLPCVEFNGSRPHALALPCNAFQTRSRSLKRKRKIVHHSGPGPAAAPAPPAMKAGIGLRARPESKNQCQSDVGKRGDIAAKHAPSIYSLINQQKRKATHKEIKEQVDKVRHHRCEEDRYKENAKTNAFDKMHKSKKMSRSVAVAPSNHHLHQWLSSTNSSKSTSKNKEVRHTHNNYGCWKKNNNYECWKKKAYSSNTMPFRISEEVYFQKKKVHSSNTIPCNVNPILEEAYVENPPIIRNEDKTEDGGSLKGTANSSNDIAINNVSTESKTDESSSVSSLFAFAPPPPPPPPFPLSRRKWFSRVVTNSCSESTSQVPDQPFVYIPPHCASASPSVEEINRSTDAFIAKDHPSVHIPPHCPSPSPSVEEINRSADAFIAEFYRQLKLQKLESVNKKASVSR